jgi:hypothetical protein
MTIVKPMPLNAFCCGWQFSSAQHREILLHEVQLSKLNEVPSVRGKSLKRRLAKLSGWPLLRRGMDFL